MELATDGARDTTRQDKLTQGISRYFITEERLNKKSLLSWFTGKKKI
jgi:hypothetical protein